jgi:hypothetical protein
VDHKHSALYASKAKFNFYKHYKKLDRVKQQNSMAGISKSAFTAMLEGSERMKVLPLSLGLVKERGNASEIQVNSYKLGDKYAQMLSEGIGCSRNSSISDFKLKDNRIT